MIAAQQYWTVTEQFQIRSSNLKCVYLYFHVVFYILTFKAGMLHICHAACIPWWPAVTYK